MFRWKKQRIAMKTKYLFFLFILYFIPTWLLIDRGSEIYPFQRLVLMSSGHDLYTLFAD